MTLLYGIATLILISLLYVGTRENGSVVPLLVGGRPSATGRD